MSKPLELVGQRFGKLVVLERTENYVSPKGLRYSRWKCSCDCRNEVIVVGSLLKRGHTQSCGCIKVSNLTGQRFGKLVVLKRVKNYIDPKGNPRSYWKCLCDCGKETTVVKNSLKRGHTQSCGCISIPDLTNQRFGRLTVLKRTKENYIDSEGRQQSRWECLCDCGKKTTVVGDSLKRKNTRSCGCYRLEKTSLPRGESGFNVLYSAYKRSAKRRNLNFEITKEQFKELTQKNCHYCNVVAAQIRNGGKTKKTKEHSAYTYNGLDRVDNKQGYVINNLVPCCGICNKMKHVLNYKDFLNHIAKIHNKHNT